MSSDKKRTTLAHSDSENSFQQAFLSLLQAISDPSTRKTATHDLKDLLRHYVDSPSRLHFALSLIAKAAEVPQKGYSKDEVLQSLGILAEIFQGKLLDFMSKILQIILTILTDEDPDLHVPLRDTLGKVVKYILNTADRAEGIRESQNVFESLWRMFRGTSKCTQMGTALCISKVLQVSKEENLRDYIDRISSKLVRLLKKPECKTKLQLMECIMNLVLLADNNSNQLAKIINAVLPVVADNIVDSQPSIRKIALEILHYMIAVAGEILGPYKNELIEIVGQLRQDKEIDIKDASFKVLNSLKEIKVSKQVVQKTLDRSQSRSAQKERQNEKSTGKYNQQQQSHKDPKKPGILKDSSYNNSPLVVTPDELQGGRSLYKTSKEKINIGPFTTKNTSSIPSDSPMEKFYSPNGAFSTQAHYNPINKEVSRFDTKYVDTRSIRKPETTKKKDREDRSNTPSVNGNKGDGTPQVRSSQPEFEKNRRPEVFSDGVSTRQFTGDGSKKSNASSPAQPELSQANLTEILAQLHSINNKQTMLMQGMDQLRFSTQDELSILKNRLSQLEGLVGKLYVHQKETGSTRTSAIFSDYNNNLKTSYSQKFAMPDQSNENSGLMERLTAEHGAKSSEKSGHDRSRVQERWRDDVTEKPKEVKPRQQLMWMKLETLLKHKNFNEAYELCLEEGDEEALLCLMKDTGPIIERLKGNLGELLLNKLKSKLYDSESRPILLEWIQRALLTRVPIAKGTLVAVQGIIRQIFEYHRGLREQERENVQKVYDYIAALLESLESSEEQEEVKPRQKLK